jgi:hypothetical protein
MSKDDVAKAVLGQLPAALAETVSLATPLTMSRIEGRDEARPARDGPSPSGSASRSSPPTTTSGPSSRSSAVARGRGWSVPRPHQGLGGHLFGGRPLRPALAVREAGPRPSGRL